MNSDRGGKPVKIAALDNQARLRRERERLSRRRSEKKTHFRSEPISIRRCEILASMSTLIDLREPITMNTPSAF
jgi:hypothetical protein